MKSKNLFLAISLFFALLAQIFFALGATSGDQNETFEWTKKSPITLPTTRTSPTMAYDIESDRIILCGGDHAYNVLEDVWAYDTNADDWTLKNSPGFGRFEGDMVYDSESDRMILFGGFDSTDSRALSNTTFAYDYNTDTWENMAQAMSGTSPCPRVTKMAYDSESDLTILFGGATLVNSSIVLFNDTWIYDYNANTWTEQSPSLAPPPLVDCMLEYDSESDRTILFGGAGMSQDYNDTWTYDADTNTWMKMNPPIAPSPRVMTPGAAYNVKLDRIILYAGTKIGGVEENLPKDILNDTWAYDHNTDSWTELGLSQSPGDIERFVLCYNNESEIVVLTAGTYRDPVTGKGDRIYNEDTWVLGAVSKKQTSEDAGFTWMPFFIAIFVVIYYRSRKKKLQASI
ncbi:MAG: kelch repeat-containing protein [Candidatus Hodarchaeota archaeon]